MKRLTHLLVSFALLTAVGCGRRAAKEEASAPPPPALPTDAPTAVLQVEDAVEWALETPGSGGPAIHLAQLAELARALADGGSPATVFPVPPSGGTPFTLSHFSSVVLVDAAVVSDTLAAELAALAARGGVVVALGELAGATPEAQRILSELFGLDLAAAERVAEPRPAGEIRLKISDHALVAGIDPAAPWGNPALIVQRVTPTTASVIAETDGAPTLTRLGNAVYLGVLPPGRRFGGWLGAGPGVAIVRNAIASANPAAIQREFSPVEIVIGLNQYGYRAGDPKRVVLRVLGGDPAQPVVGSWDVRSSGGDALASGELEVATQVVWNSRYAFADLGLLREPGVYRFRVGVGDTETSRVVRVLGDAEWVDGLLRLQETFFEGMRCGEVCHTDATPPGGYHHAADVRGARMESMPFAVLALAAIVEARPDLDRFTYELERSVRWCWQMVGADGWPRAAPGSEEHASFSSAAAFAAALARAVPAVRDYSSRNLAQEVQVAAERVLLLLAREPVTTTSDIGARLWAAAELARLTGIPDYAAIAEADARRLFVRQVQRGRVAGGDLYGDFVETDDATTLAPRQYRRELNPGVYLGLATLARATTNEALRADLTTVLGRIDVGLLTGYASLTPYGVLAAGIEPAVPLKPRPASRGGFEAPESFAPRLLQPPLPGLPRAGGNAGLLMAAAFAAQSFERGDAFAAAQIDWVLGANPLGLAMMRGLPDAPAAAPGPDPVSGFVPDGAIYNGIVGRGAALEPVWSAGDESRSVGLLANAWLLAILAELAR